MSKVVWQKALLPNTATHVQHSGFTLHVFITTRDGECTCLPHALDKQTMCGAFGRLQAVIQN